MNETELTEYIRCMLSEDIQNLVTREIMVTSIINIDKTLDNDTIHKIIVGKLYDFFKNKKIVIAISIKITKRLKEVDTN
ncbi:MAG: hypothetical protein KAK00_00305 [Nanoarchaeota archaeon]|nr:hypothetical protein [Nanoarchaeota archaeon]